MILGTEIDVEFIVHTTCIPYPTLLETRHADETYIFIRPSGFLARGCVSMFTGAWTGDQALTYVG